MTLLIFQESKNSIFLILFRYFENLLENRDKAPKDYELKLDINEKRS